MAKKYFLPLALAAVYFTANAETYEPLPISLDGIVCRTTFWGTEASDKPNNPCKGATWRKCAEIDTQIAPIGNGINSVKTILRDKDGVIKSIETTTTTATAEEIINYITSHTPVNAQNETLAP